MVILKISNKEIKGITGYSLAENDIYGSGSGRAVTGMMHKDYITTKAKIKIAFKLIKDSDLNSILKLIKSPENIDFDVTYYSPYIRGLRTANCHKGETENGMHMVKDGEVYWKDVSMNFIEN